MKVYRLCQNRLAYHLKLDLSASIKLLGRFLGRGQVMLCNNNQKFCTTTNEDKVTKKNCCQMLGLSEEYSNSQLKDSFLKLAKKYHPDSASEFANAEKFYEVESAYRTLKNMEPDKSDLDDVYKTLENDFGIKHTAPQHRQYLSLDGVGYGSPNQRQGQYQIFLVNRAIQNVHEHKIRKANALNEDQLVLKDAALARQYKTSQAMERLVEDLIQESMARGEFDNLPGSGKPLKTEPENPYVDSMTQKLNQILINNGFTPEWIVLEKEIQEEREKLQRELRKRRAHLGPPPIGDEQADCWIDTLADLQEAICRLNGRIDKFNIIVPILKKQQFHFGLAQEAKKVLKREPETFLEVKDQKRIKPEDAEGSFLGLLFSFIK